MQTFLPAPGFAVSARLLDDRRLGKQRVESFQILRALTWPTYAWKNHPAVAMWRGFVPALVRYTVETCAEWVRRGFSDAVRDQVLEFTAGCVPTVPELAAEGRLPLWLGTDAVHRSHRSALVRKEPEHYRRYFPDVPDDLPYVWPRPAFPRWPVRRGHLAPVRVEQALALLGFTDARPEQRTAVDAVRAGRDHLVRLPPGGGSRSAGLLAGLATPGRTLWLTAGLPPNLSPGAWDDDLPAPRRGRPAGAAASARRPTPSTARAPGAADLAATVAEATADAEFRFFRAARPVSEVAPAALEDVGLVVLDGVAADAPDDAPDAATGLVADARLHGVPRLTLLRRPAPVAHES